MLNRNGLIFARPSLETRKRMQWLGRVGFAGRGLFYVIVGVCALWAAIYAGNNDVSESTITEALLDHPLGIVLIGAIGLAFVANSIWLFYKAIFRPTPAAVSSANARLWMHRWASAALALLFAGLAATVGALLAGLAHPGHLHAISRVTGTAMTFGPLGRLAVAAAGCITMLVAIFQMVAAWRHDLRSTLDVRSLPPFLRGSILLLARAGITSRDVVIGMVGFFLIVAAWKSNAQAARGPTQSLRVLEYQRFGPWLLGAIAIGLVGYGIYLLITAWYRSFDGGANRPGAASKG